MRLNMNIEFESTAEMKVFLMTPHPFGAFLDNFVEVAAADKAVAEVRTDEAKADLQETIAEIVEKPKRTRKKKEEPTEAAPAPIPAAPVEPVPMAAPPAAPVAPTALGDALAQAAPVAPAPTAAVTYTESDLSQAGAGLVTAGKKVEVVNLLNMKYGANGQGIPAIDPSRYAELAADFRAMGAQI